MQIFKNNYKKIFLILIIIIILIIIVTSSVLIFNESIFEKTINSRTETFTSEVETFILKNSKVKKTPENVQDIFKVLKDPKVSDKSKYERLIYLSFLFSSQYSLTQDPRYREFSAKIIEKYAEDNFPSLYHTENFNIPCADPVCGQEFTPEIKEVFSLIEKSKMSEDYKRVISTNLKVGGHMPDSEVEEIEIVFKVVYEDLILTSDPVASEAAEKLSEYAKSKYKIDLKMPNE